MRTGSRAGTMTDGWGHDPRSPPDARAPVTVGSFLESAMLTVSSSVRSRVVSLATGVTLPYVESGDPDGLPVILLHGFTDSWRSYEPVLPHLPAEIRALALTQRGHGDADKPPTGYTPADFAADVAAFLAALGLDQAVVVGHSMGGSVAQRFAIDQPGLCRGLVLMATTSHWSGNPVVVEFGEAVVEMADPIDPAFVHEFQASTVVLPVPDSVIATAVAESLKVPARVWRDALRLLLETDVTHELGRIAAQALVLAGGRDDYTPSEAQRALQSGIPDARLIVYPDSGHAIHWEDPAQVAADIAAFVRSLPSSAEL
jgi:non-heme chloroperoxidase